VVTRQLQVERKTGKVRRPKTDVLPLCYATNLLYQVSARIFLQVFVQYTVHVRVIVMVYNSIIRYRSWRLSRNNSP